MESTKNTNLNEESMEPAMQSKEDTVAVLTDNAEVENENETVTEATDKSEVEAVTETTDNPKVETVTEPETVTAPENAENDIEKNQYPNSSSKCSKCGAVLTSEQVFCPNCGQKNEVLIENNVADAIKTFNEGIDKKSKFKNGKAKILIIASSVIVALVILVVASFFYFNSKSEDIIKKIESGNVSQSVIDDYNALTPVGQFFHRDKIVDAFVEQVADNPYSNDSSGIVVDEELLDKYLEYKNFADSVKITDRDGTNVVDYIDAVLKLNEYREYNGVQKCVYNSIGSYSDCLDYITDADDFSTSYFIDLYLGYAYSSAIDAVEEAEEYNTGDRLCTEYVNALKIVEDEVGNLYYDDYYSSSRISEAFDTISETFGSLSDAKDSVENIVSNLPKIK